jgi:hypothetical protein
MSRQDPGAATGQIPYLPTRCTCGCLSTLHNLTPAGKRTGCSNSNCSCKAFVEVPRCVRCKTGDATGLCCEAHGKQLCHRCYRRTHFVEACVEGCTDCAREGLDVRLP